MAFITYPLNMVDYTAEDAELFHCTRNSGIYADDDFQCIASGVDNTITVGEGIGWIRNGKYSGKVFANKTAEVVDLGLADANLPRYDVVAIQFNKAQNLTKIVVKNGTPANSPTIPERSVTESIYELYLCKVFRPVGALTITADDVTDTRLDPALCGIMADSVTSIDTSAIDTQVKALIDNLEAEIQGVKDSSGLMHTSDWVEDGVIPIEKTGFLRSKYIVAQGIDSNGWRYEKWSDGTYKAYQDRTESLTTTSSTDSVLKYMQFAQIAVISTNPIISKSITNYNVEILKTDSYGWLAKMSGSTPKANFRYFRFNPESVTFNITTRHFIEGRWM